MLYSLVVSDRSFASVDSFNLSFKNEGLDLKSAETGSCFCSSDFISFALIELNGVFASGGGISTGSLESFPTAG